MRKTLAKPAAGAQASRRYYRWDAAPGGPSILLDAGVAQRIQDQVLEGFRALPKRGMEVGGILLGQVVQNDPLQVRIEEMEAAPCEHRFGPSFTLSPQDREQLEAALDRLGGDGRLSVVGYYRSCTGRDLALDASDEELIQAYFSSPDQVCLGVAPVSARECVAALFSWPDGRIPSEPATSTFRLHVEADAIAEPEVPEPPPVAPSVVPPPAPERRTIAAPPPPSRDQRLWPWMLVLLMAAGCAFLYERWQSARHDWSAPLGLSVAQTSAGLDVSWDASSPVVQNAGRGLVSITEDGKERRLELDASAVKRASLSLTPSADDVLIRLTVYGPDMQSAAESFRIVARGHLTPSAPDAAPAAEKPGAAAPPQQELPSAPPVETVDVPAPEPPPAEKSAPVAARAAQPIHQVQPGISEGIRARIRTTIVVPVDVEISASGNVSSAVAQGDGDALYRYLAERAAIAARTWRFEPARSRNGTAIRSTKTLYFSFKG